jgi:DNA-binding CsgD family transcriptional regulator
VVSRRITHFARRALAAPTRDELRRETLSALQPAVGFDFGIVWRPGEAEATLEGFDRRFWETYREREACYAGDMSALAGAACAEAGVTRDVTALDGPRRRRSAFYAEIIRPLGAGSFLTAVMRLRGQVVGLMQLGRAPGFEFPERAAQSLRELLPIVTLAEAARPAPPLSPSACATNLSPREREVLGYVTLGLTNREIATACGTSPHTVRNQLVSLFKKAEVTTRAELVSWALGGI